MVASTKRTANRFPNGRRVPFNDYALPRFAWNPGISHANVIEKILSYFSSLSSSVCIKSTVYFSGTKNVKDVQQAISQTRDESDNFHAAISGWCYVPFVGPSVWKMLWTRFHFQVLGLYWSPSNSSAIQLSSSLTPRFQVKLRESTKVPG